MASMIILLFPRTTTGIPLVPGRVKVMVWSTLFDLVSSSSVSWEEVVKG